MTPTTSGWKATVSSAATTAATNAKDIINWPHVSSLVRYDSWPDLPRWVKIALSIGAGSFLFYKAMQWILNRKRFESWRRVGKLYKTFLPIIVDYKWAELKIKRNKIGDDESATMYEKLHKKHAPKARAFVDEVAGVYTKVGQVCCVHRFSRCSFSRICLVEKYFCWSDHRISWRYVATDLARCLRWMPGQCEASPNSGSFSVCLC